MAMTAIRYREASPGAEKVLVIAADPAEAIEHRREIGARSAELTSVCEVSEAAEAARSDRYDAVFVFARPDAEATALLLALLKAEAAGAPRLMLLVAAAEARRYAAAMCIADETLALSLSIRRVCDAAGLGLRSGFPQRLAFG
jgi:hypothetical protein